MKKNLILKSDYKYSSENLKNFFFLNKFHTTLLNKSLKNEESNFLDSSINYSRKYKKKAYLICEKIYCSIIKDLTTELNKLHSLSKKQKYWEIILAHWLKRFIYISYYNYEILTKTFLKKKLNLSILAINSEKINLYTKETCGIKKAANNHEWNFVLISKMLKYFNFNTQVIYKKKKINKDYLIGDYKNFSLKTKFLKILHYIFKIFYKKNDILFFNSGLPFFFEKKLELSLGQFPSFFYPFESILYNNKFDINLRNKLNFKKNNLKNLENFIRQQLPGSIPFSLIETYKEILGQIKNSKLPTNPKNIVTAYAFDCNDSFKIYVAEKIEKKSQYTIIQHGNNYFTSIDSNYYPEVNLSDKFLTWGCKENKKHFPLFNISVIGKKNVFNVNGNLTIINNYAGWRYWVTDPFDIACSSADSINRIIKNLDSNIKKNTSIKLFPLRNTLEDFIYNNYFKKIKNFKTRKISFFNLYKNTRLFLFTYDSTGLLQNLALNVPCVGYWENLLDNINLKYLKYYKLLIKAKILFKNEKDLVKHINTNWNKINEWWFHSNTQNNILKFNKSLNNFPNNNKVKKLLKNLNKSN